MRHFGKNPEDKGPIREILPLAAKEGRVDIGLWTGLVLFLVGVMFPSFQEWLRLARESDLHSHVILIPGVSLYLLVSGRHDLAWRSTPSRVIGAAIFGAAAAGLFFMRNHSGMISGPGPVAANLLVFLCGVWGAGLLTVGWGWMRSALFPLGFLLFMVPLPDSAAAFLEHQLMVGSAHVSEWFFKAGGMPVFRNGQVLELPGTVLVVAEECSGIRSTWVLLITGALAAYMFIPKGPRQWILVIAVMPLGVIRNAFRICVIGWLCVNYGNDMIDSWIHRKGGPVFFLVSLFPLFMLAWLLRKRKSRNFAGQPGEASRLGA